MSELVRIGELARRVGVPPATLRAWERRYGILRPARTESGYRLYSDVDEQRLRAMIELITRGQAPAEAAARVLEDGAPAAGPEPPPTASESLGDELFDRLAAFDGTGAQRVIDRAVDSYSVEGLIERVVLPVLRVIGARWEAGELTVGQEHFASHLLRARLLAIGRSWESGSGPTALLACPPGEEHDLGLVCLGLLLRERGWRIAFLGADTPLGTVAETAERVEPRAVVLTVTAPEVAVDLDGDLADRIAAPLYVAGASATSLLAERLGGELLEPDLIAGARMLASSGRDG
ncbi:MAG TPA: MerR family transcriptional regulator [Solirubrobacterales bacterium]|nr:MerR family transcriptional regulator [Solirubrobacterales bacterium]